MNEEKYSLAELLTPIERPHLLYFTGHACINNRKFEFELNNYPKDLKFIEENYKTYCLYLDSKTELSKKEIEKLDKERKSIKHLGK